MRDLANSLTVRRAISPAAAVTDNTPLVSQIVDLAGFSKALFAIAIGNLADADATFAVTVDHGDVANLSDAAAVPAAKLTGTLVAASFASNHDDQVREIGYVGGKRYVRLTITPSNNTGAAFVSAVAILSGSRYGPN